MENQALNFDFVFLGQSVLKYQVPLDIFISINQIYEQDFYNLYKANKQLVGKIEKEHSLFYDGADQTTVKNTFSVPNVEIVLLYISQIKFFCTFAFCVPTCVPLVPH